MNVERLTKLAEWLEAGAPHENIVFDMARGIQYDVKPHEFDPESMPACETACCIAGAAVQFFGDTKDAIPENLPFQIDEEDAYLAHYTYVPWSQVRKHAMRLLGIDIEQAELLFRPHPLALHDDPAWAARTIRGFIATGHVDWAAHQQD